MNSFISLTVMFTKDQSRVELVNLNKVYRIIARQTGSAVCFNASGSDYIEVKESKEEIERLLG